MKVGKSVVLIALPIVTIIYATNMQLISVYRFGNSVEEYAKDVQKAINDYEEDRSRRAAIYDEVD